MVESCHIFIFGLKTLKINLQVNSHPKTKHEREQGEKGATSEKGLFKKVKEEIFRLLATSDCPEVNERFANNLGTSCPTMYLCREEYCVTKSEAFAVVTEQQTPERTRPMSRTASLRKAVMG